MSHSETLGAEDAPLPSDPATQTKEPSKRLTGALRPYEPTGFGAAVDRQLDQAFPQERKRT